MAIVLVEGFDLLTGADVLTKYPLSDTLSPSVVAGRFGGQAFVADSSNQNRFLGLAIAATTTLAVGAALELPSGTLSGAGGSPGTGLIRFYDSANNIQGGVQVGSNGTLYITRSTNVVLATGNPGDLVGGVFNYIEVEWTLSDTVGAVNVYVNGALKVSCSGVDNKNSANNNVSQIRFTTSGTGNNGLKVDDVYVTNTAARLGECKVETLSPTADSGTQQWGRSAGANNYALVDEKPENGDTDYVTAATAGLIDRYVMADLSDVPASIFAVQPVLFGRKDDAATRSIRTSMVSGATTANGTTLALTNSYLQALTIYELDPNTSGAWTPSAVNALLLGPESV
jgi:hypothetical protein